MATSDLETRVSVNPIACDAYGYCAELLPELVTLDEWGYPITSDAPVPPELVAMARQAAKECPRRAFLVERARAATATVVRSSARTGDGSR
jgi:ferredoxin